MSIAEKLTTVAENMPKVFEAGKQAEYDAFWDALQQSGTRTDYAYGFTGPGWNDENFKPKYDIVLVDDARGLFRSSKQIVNLKQCLESCGVELVFSGVTTVTEMCAWANNLTTFPKLDLSYVDTASRSGYLYNGCTRLQTIDEVRVSDKTVFNANSFSNCKALTRLIMTGTLATNGLDLHWSPLDKESLLSIIGVLQDNPSAGGTWTVTLGTENLAKLTDAEKAVATQKGWTLV